MRGDDAGAQFAAARVRDLQPAGRPGATELGMPVPMEILDAFLAEESRESARAKKLQESVDRRLADQRIVGLLAKKGFEGPQYDRFVDELVRYGIAVLKAWLCLVDAGEEVVADLFDPGALSGVGPVHRTARPPRCPGRPRSARRAR
ncbi:hypothetical protein ACWDD9_31565 [Kitasatospora sp. NPDC001119]